MVDCAERYGARYSWRSLMVVPGHTQVTRASLLAARCFRGAVVVPAPSPSFFSLLYGCGLRVGAPVQALVVERGC